MHPHIESPQLGRSLKRSFDRCDSESLPPAKRHQLPPTPPTASHSFDKASQPNCSQAAPLSPPEPSRILERRALAHIDPTSHPPPKKSRIEGWLEEVSRSPPIRASSCPPQLENSNLLQTIEIDEGQPLSFDVVHEMSQSERQSNGAGSIASGRSSRLSTSHPDYRKILRNNGIKIDDIGEKIPSDLRRFLDVHILQERSSKLSPEAIDAAVETAISMEESLEANVYSLADTALLPIKRPGIGRGGNTPWCTDGLPRNEVYPYPLAAPKADIHIGYPTDRTSKWKVEENAVIDHDVAKRLTQPAKGNSFPFFVFEIKSEAMGGNHWQLENHAAGSGAGCVNTMRWLYREAYPSEDPSIVDTIAFSASVTHRLAIYHVHFYLPEENQHYMSWIATRETMRQIQKSNHLVESIFEHCLGARQTKVRKALSRLYPFPHHWKNSRPASAMESQNPAVAENEGSNKSQRIQ